MTKSDLRCFVALAGILPVIRYARTRRFNTLGAILIASACDSARTLAFGVILIAPASVQF